MQLFLLIPIFVYIFTLGSDDYVSPKLRFLRVSALIIPLCLICMILNGVKAYQDGFRANIVASDTKDPTADFYDEMYDKPWMRMGPYLVGLC